ncbi:NAD(P)-dependent oxidoreductase [Myroides sp. LJL119]
MKIGIIKERKFPPDRRVALCPNQVKNALEQYKDLNIKVESSLVRIFSDQEYLDLGIEVSDDLSDCDVIIGLKEIPVKALIPNKTYLIFSHTIKKQIHNRELLQACLRENITLMDHETLVNQDNKRIIGFGRYAGIVGAYNTLRAFGIKYELFNLAKAETLKTKDDLIYRLKKQFFPPIKVVVTGTGKVANGIMEILEGMKMKKVDPDKFLTQKYDRPVYTQIDVTHYYKRIDGTQGSKQDFYDYPELYTSDFERFSEVADILITGHFFKKGSPVILSKQMLNSAKNQIKVIGDISCDVDQGPIHATIRTSNLENPYYGYHPKLDQEVELDHPASITVMAIDNLPCALPYDSSRDFGDVFIKEILPAFFNEDIDKILEKATITKSGSLTDNYKYLQDFVDSNQ